MREVFICDAARTAIGRYGGALAKVRTDDLAAVPIKALVARNDKADWSRLDEVFFGCANQSGEDNRNVARMALLLAGLPDSIPGVTVNRLCASGLNAVGDAARAIRSGEMEFAIAGGVESMTRAPFVMGKAAEAFSRTADVYDTTLGWRFINPLMKAQYGVDSMAETGENVAEEFQVSRKDQDAFALRSQQRAANAIATGYFANEIVPVQAPGGKAGPIVVNEDEHPRPDTTLETLQKLKPIVRNPGTITAGNASGINDGAAAIILASEDAVKAHGLKARARVLGMASAGVPPRIMGIGPVPSTRKLMERLGLKDFRFRSYRAQRGVRLARHRRVAPARRCRRCRARQSARRRHRARPSARHVGRAADTDRGPWPGKARRQARARHHVRRRGAGRVVGVGEGLGLSSSAKADDPVTTESVAITGCPAFAGHDNARRIFAVPMSPGYIPFHPNPSKPKYKPPAGAVDAHCHVFGPEHAFPYAPERKYTPCDAPKEKLFALRDFLGLDKNVIVQASCHSKDNRAMVDALDASNGRAKGVAFVGEEVTDDELKWMDKAGVRGVRFNFIKRLVDFTPRDVLARIAARVHKLGWHIVVYFEMPDLPELEDFFTALPTTVVVDHMGTPDVRKGVDHPENQRFHALMEKHKNFWVKVTCPERMSLAGPPYDDVVPFGRALVERFGDRVIWGTDWPHPNMKKVAPDDGVLVDYIPKVAPTAAQQQALLVDNPMRLYWS